MQTLRLITSCSQQNLLEALADNISSAPLSPLEKESIVILSNGMARWISMELAARLGVSAGLEFSFPNELLDKSFKEVLSEAHLSLPYTLTALTWRIASQLPALALQKDFEQVAAYLGKERDDRRLLQISHSIATCFDQYTIFRPELVLAWDDGNDDDWQAQLWRAVNRDCHGNHRAASLKKLHSHVSNGVNINCGLPRRISVFGISYLPPFHLETLRLLSSYCEVTCYLLNPCGQYWGTIISEKKKSAMALRSAPSIEAEEYYETGNPLLSSLGTLGQEFFETLLEYGFEVEELDNPPDNSPNHSYINSTGMLATIQNDILTLLDRRTDATKTIVSANDSSIQIHSCHGALREMEVLYDNLLAAFDELPSLEPRHVVVMIPDIESYAPYISSVFGSKASGRPPLPYTIADRSVRSENLYVDTFLKVINMCPSRFATHDILDLLETAAVMSRFDIDEDELMDIRDWLNDCNVRWGLDADHRAELGFPRYADFSWQTGMDKLFLGYAMAPDDSSTFNGILPHHACSGQRAEALGKLTEFISTLRSTNKLLSAPHTLSEWADILNDAVSNLLLAAETDTAGSLIVAKAISSLDDACTLHGFTESITLDAVRDLLSQSMANNGGGYGFMGGSITFCAMLPMRSIPMRIVWLAGMNDGQFPRTDRQPGFSLMNGARRRGDRSLRDEDRYLFLEALMAAGDRFCISYNGQNDRDNSSIPSSVLVAELIDYIDNSFTQMDGVTAADPVIKHRLQGFSPLYFNGNDPAHLFSYDRDSMQAVEARRQSERSGREFISEALPFDSTQMRQIDLPQLVRFLTNPAAAFLEQRLKIIPFNLAEEPDDSEPFALDALPRYALSQELVSQHLNGTDYDECLSAARSHAELPPLSAGNMAFKTIWESSRRFAAELEPQLGLPLEALSINFVHNNLQLCAVLKNCQSVVHTRWRCANLKGKDRLTIWLDHLLLNVAKTEGYPRHSKMIASDQTLELPPIEHAVDILSGLLDLYCEGMQRPLPFFPETSWAFLKDGQGKAEARWSGDKWVGNRGERDNQAITLCFGNEYPWSEEFCALAERVFGPLIAAIQLK